MGCCEAVISHRAVGNARVDAPKRKRHRDYSLHHNKHFHSRFCLLPSVSTAGWPSNVGPKERLSNREPASFPKRYFFFRSRPEAGGAGEPRGKKEFGWRSARRQGREPHCGHEHHPNLKLSSHWLFPVPTANRAITFDCPVPDMRSGHASHRRRTPHRWRHPHFRPYLPMELRETVPDDVVGPCKCGLRLSPTALQTQCSRRAVAGGWVRVHPPCARSWFFLASFRTGR